MTDLSFINDTIMDLFDHVLSFNTYTGAIHIIKSSFHFDITSRIYISEFVEKARLYYDIYTDDIAKFQMFKNFDSISKYVSQYNSGTLLSFRILENDSFIWKRVSFVAPKDYSSNNPNVLLLVRTMSYEESSAVEANHSIAKNNLKITRFNLTTKRYNVVSQPAYETFVNQKTPSDDFSNGFSVIKEDMVHPDDVSIYIHYTSYEFLSRYFTDRTKKLSFYYRRLITNTYRWVRHEIITTSEFSPDNLDFVSYLVDVHDALMHYFNNTLVAAMNEFNQSENPITTNVLSVLDVFTQKYLDFYMIDLEKDEYIRYKFDPKIPEDQYRGSYSELLKNNISLYLEGEKAEAAIHDSSIEMIRHYLTNKVTVEYDFVTRNGQTIHTKLMKTESVDGIPTKCLCGSKVLPAKDTLKVVSFGNFEVYDKNGNPIHFTKSKSKEVLAYLIDKQGYPVSNRDISIDILEKDDYDTNAQKYVSALLRYAIKDLACAGYENIIIKERSTSRINTEAIDCDYYHVMKGDTTYWDEYHNEYMKDYSWSEETNAELQHMFDY